MKELVKKVVIVTLMALAVHFAPAGTVLAQEGGEAPDPIEKVIEQRPPGWDQGIKEGWDERDMPPGLRRKAGELRRLRKENPEEYQQLVKKRKQNLRKRLHKLRREDPEKFKEVVNNRRERVRNRLERLRREDPERFKETISQRKKLLRERLERIKKEDPERYERIMKRREECEAFKGGTKARPNRSMRPSGSGYRQKNHGGRR